MDDLDEIRDIVSNSASARENLRKAVQKRIRAHLVSIVKQGVSIAAKNGTDSIVICMPIGQGDIGRGSDVIQLNSELKEILGVTEGRHTIKLGWSDFSFEIQQIMEELGFDYVIHKAHRNREARVLKGGGELSTSFETVWYSSENDYDRREEFFIPERLTEPSNELIGICFGVSGKAEKAWKIDGYYDGMTVEGDFDEVGCYTHSYGESKAYTISLRFHDRISKEEALKDDENRWAPFVSAFLVVPMQFDGSVDES